MDEAQRLGMEGEAVDRACLGAVAAVASDGVAEVLAMDTYLVFAACVKLDLKHRVAVTAL